MKIWKFRFLILSFFLVKVSYFKLFLIYLTSFLFWLLQNKKLSWYKKLFPVDINVSYFKIRLYSIVNNSISESKNDCDMFILFQLRIISQWFFFVKSLHRNHFTGLLSRYSGEFIDKTWFCYRKFSETVHTI